MQLTKQSNLSQFNLSRYEPGLFIINEEAYHHSLLISSRFCRAWEPLRANCITQESWDDILALRPELVIIGTGEQALTLAPQLLEPLIVNKIRFEVMNTASAARTFHLLVSEGRSVIGALCIL